MRMNYLFLRLLCIVALQENMRGSLLLKRHIQDTRKNLLVLKAHIFQELHHSKQSLPKKAHILSTLFSKNISKKDLHQNTITRNIATAAKQWGVSSVG